MRDDFVDNNFVQDDGLLIYLNIIQEKTFINVIKYLYT